MTNAQLLPINEPALVCSC